MSRQSASHQSVNDAVRSSQLLRPSMLSSSQLAMSNQTMQRLLNEGEVQAKLSVNTPDDPFEREADRVADQVIRTSSAAVAASEPLPSIQRACSSCTEESEEQSIQRMCDECEEELHRKESNHSQPEMTAAVESQISALQNAGEPLSAQTRSFFEPRFNRDFSDVRVHADRAAAQTAESVNALAYTRGNHIVFKTGQYQPNTAGGRRLLAHELTHVVQQNQANRTAPNVQRLGDVSQKPADLACDIANSSSANVFSDIFFPINSNAIDGAGVAKIAGFIATWEQAGSDDQVRVDGFASTDGPDPLNWTLSCNRARAVVNELEHPTRGTGIPASFITEVFANGETDEFSATSLELNRRATIAADLTEPPACDHPGVVRTVDLQPIFLRTDPTDASPTGVRWSTLLNTANDIWGKIGVTFNELAPVTIDTPLKAGGSTAAERTTIRGLRSAAGVEVFLVNNHMGGPGGVGGADTLPPIGAGCGATGSIVMSDIGTSDTLLAHELGHILGIDHPTDLPPFNPGDANTVMEPSGSDSVTNPPRNTMVNFSRILCPDPVGSVCLNPDP